MKEVRDMAGMPRIDENRHFTPDQISVAIVLIGILPQIGIEVFFDFHLIPVKGDVPEIMISLSGDL